MQQPPFSKSLEATEFFFVGIKGTGMSALAEFLTLQGAKVEGSDTKETFPTEFVLKKAGISYREGFDARNVPEREIVVVYSPAYDPEVHPELAAAKKRGLICVEYNAMLGYVSSRYISAGVSGVHGKTTTTALAGMIIKTTGIPATVMVPTGVPGFGGGSVYAGGNDFFLTETCEYRRHFLDFSPQAILVTNLELEHTDYFKDEEDIELAFFEYSQRLPRNGKLIYCADDPGATALAERVGRDRASVTLIPYGLSAEGEYKITGVRAENGHTDFIVSDTAFTLRVPGRHNVLNATGALALVDSVRSLSQLDRSADFLARAALGISSFTGSRRRCEVIADVCGITVVDDYAHHPTEIKVTIDGLREFYPGRRIIVDFMPHLYSRTADLFVDFSHAFNGSDVTILHGIYASAREKEGTVTGRHLYDAVKKVQPETEYFPSHLDAIDRCMDILRNGDVFVTMGAGDNWQLGKAIARQLHEKEIEK